MRIVQKKERKETHLTDASADSKSPPQCLHFTSSLLNESQIKCSVKCFCLGSLNPVNSPSPPPPLPQRTGLTAWCCEPRPSWPHCKTPAGRPECEPTAWGRRRHCCSWLTEEGIRTQEQKT